MLDDYTLMRQEQSGLPSKKADGGKAAKEAADASAKPVKGIKGAQRPPVTPPEQPGTEVT